MFGGNAGCFYTINDVQVTYTHLSCSNDNIYGHGAPVNGLYFDGSGTGQGIIPTHVQSPWVTSATGAAITTNYTAGMSIADGQISVSHQSLNMLTNSGGLSMKDTLLEAGAIPDVVSSGNTFVSVSFSGAGLTVSGHNNVFVTSEVGELLDFRSWATTTPLLAWIFRQTSR